MDLIDWLIDNNVLMWYIIPTLTLARRIRPPCLLIYNGFGGL